MAIKREELAQKREEILAKIKDLNKGLKKTRYITNRYYEGIGVVESMDEADLCAALKDLKARFAEDDEFNALAKELGLNVETKKEDEDEEKTYLGYTYDEWMEDFKTRAAYLTTVDKVYKLEEALDIIDENLSEDDKFNLAMKDLEDLL
ncbi:MAG: hypothetical protein IKS60_08420 [Lachnospiraceae bacterium]|nr:hypothetical protein [Lachnospiraceae bacterium]